MWKEEENAKKIRWTLKALISGTAWWIQLKFETDGAPPQGNLYGRFRVFLFRECQTTDAWKQRFLYSCKIHPCLSCALGFLGCTTHYCVSWLLHYRRILKIMSHTTVNSKLSRTEISDVSPNTRPVFYFLCWDHTLTWIFRVFYNISFRINST